MTISGDIDVIQIDAPAGVTINAVAGVSGTYKLASGGELHFGPCLFVKFRV